VSFPTKWPPLACSGVITRLRVKLRLPGFTPRLPLPIAVQLPANSAGDRRLFSFRSQLHSLRGGLDCLVEIARFGIRRGQCGKHLQWVVIWLPQRALGQLHCLGAIATQWIARSGQQPSQIVKRDRRVRMMPQYCPVLLDGLRRASHSGKQGGFVVSGATMVGLQLQGRFVLLERLVDAPLTLQQLAKLTVQLQISRRQFKT